MLQEEGFRYQGYVDIFDAGPTVEAYLHEIRAVRHSRLWTVGEEKAAPSENAQPWLLASTGLSDFRMTVKLLDALHGVLPLDDDTAQMLGVRGRCAAGSAFASAAGFKPGFTLKIPCIKRISCHAFNCAWLFEHEPFPSLILWWKVLASWRVCCADCLKTNIPGTFPAYICSFCITYLRQVSFTWCFSTCAAQPRCVAQFEC